MSAPEFMVPQTPARALTSVLWFRCHASVTELVVFDGCETTVAEAARADGFEWPAMARCIRGPGALLLSVRPRRALLIGAGVASKASAWCRRCDDGAAILDQSGGLSLLWLRGAGLQELMATSCRLDPRQYLQPGVASATLLAQVSVILASSAQGLLLLTQSTFAQHMQEWLCHQGAEAGPDESLEELLTKDWA